jgi:PsbP
MFMRLAAIFLLVSSVVSAQATKPAPNKNPAGSKPGMSYFCNQDLGYCFDFPMSWKMLGQVYEGYGTVVAPPQEGDQANWANVTVAAVEVPTEEGKNPPIVEDLVTSLVGKMAEQVQNMETVRRSTDTLAQRPAQLLQVRYDEGGKRWNETIVATDGGNGMFYTIVYKSAAADEAKYQKGFEDVLKTFRVKE